MFDEGIVSLGEPAFGETTPLLYLRDIRARIDRPKPAEARVTKWQHQWEATQGHSNLKIYDIHPKEQLPSGDTLPWRTWRTANRVRPGQAATPAAKHLCGYRENKHCMYGAATCDLNHIMTSCTHFGEIPSKDDIAEMEGRAVRWISAVADTI